MNTHSPAERRRSTLAVVLLSVGLGLSIGCDLAPAVATEAVRVDSAGIAIVTSGAEDTELTWRFEEVGVLKDSVGEPWIFTNVTGRTLLTDRAGRTYVLTRDPSIIRFDRDGSYERTIGRAGGGPGEMRFPLALRTQGDTLVVYDVVKRALVRWAPALEPVPDRRLEGALENARGITFRAGGVWFQRSDVSDTLVATALYADSSSAPLLRVATRSSGSVNFGCVSMSYVTPIFAPELIWESSGPRIAVNAQPGYSIEIYEGPRLMASVRRSLPRRAPTITDVRALHPEGMKIAFGGAREVCTVPVEELIEKQGLADAMPAVHGLALLSDGTIWVQRSVRNAGVPVLDVFRADGSYEGTVRGRSLPLALLPNGEMLFSRVDESSGGVVIERTRVRRTPRASM